MADIAMQDAHKSKIYWSFIRASYLIMLGLYRISYISYTNIAVYDDDDYEFFVRHIVTYSNKDIRFQVLGI